MANNSLNLSSLDFDTLKSNFKEYMKSQSVFKDYNFDGSNISVLLDVMAYNSYLNSFYLNMVASEMFLDSAQKYESVVSHAKELNYAPRSAHASVANISFTIATSGIANKLTIPKGTRFFGFNSNGSYSFVTDQTTSYVSSNSEFVVDNLQINEGTYFQDSFIVDYDIETQRFLLANKNVDTTSITVIVTEAGVGNTEFVKKDTLFGLDNTSEIYFLQGAESNKYEIVFGDGLFGRKPLNGSTVTVSYIVTNGSEGNGVDNFTLSDDLAATNGGQITASDITVISPSISGANQESIESVRFSAPRYFATQQRAVSSDDYAALVETKFGGQVDDVVIYGGQELEPKLYGRVIVSVKPSGSTVAPEYLKNEITNYLQDYIALPNRVKISDPDYFYIKINSEVQYNIRSGSKSLSEVSSVVLNAITTFSNDNLEKFGNDFRYSRLVTAIDNSDTYVTSNDTKVYLIKKIAPKLNYATSFDISFNNRAEQEGIYDGVAYPDERVLTSSSFNYIDNDNVVWSICFMEDDSLGNIIIYSYINNKKYIINHNIGTIDYLTGRVIITNLKVSEYVNNISLYLTTLNRDIISSKNMILIIDPNDVIINVLETVK
jgi:hypothetical protein